MTVYWGCMLLLLLSMEHVEIPPPTILKPVELWTGKQVMNLMIRPNPLTRVIANFDLKEREYDSKQNLKWMCLKDGWVYIREGELLCGQTGKKTLGVRCLWLFSVRV